MPEEEVICPCEPTQMAGYTINVLNNGVPIPELTLYRQHPAVNPEVLTMSATAILNLDRNSNISVELVSDTGHKFEIEIGDIILSIQALRWF
jgi:hypothetical protein